MERKTRRTVTPVVSEKERELEEVRRQKEEIAEQERERERELQQRGTKPKKGEIDKFPGKSWSLSWTSHLDTSEKWNQPHGLAKSDEQIQREIKNSGKAYLYTQYNPVPSNNKKQKYKYSFMRDNDKLQFQREKKYQCCRITNN